MVKDSVLILYAGGTIGMDTSEGGFKPMKDFAEYCEKALKTTVNDLPNFEILS